MTRALLRKRRGASAKLFQNRFARNRAFHLRHRFSCLPHRRRSGLHRWRGIAVLAHKRKFLAIQPAQHAPIGAFDRKSQSFANGFDSSHHTVRTRSAVHHLVARLRNSFLRFALFRWRVLANRRDFLPKFAHGPSSSVLDSILEIIRALQNASRLELLVWPAHASFSASSSDQAYVHSAEHPVFLPRVVPNK